MNVNSALYYPAKVMKRRLWQACVAFTDNRKPLRIEIGNDCYKLQQGVFFVFVFCFCLSYLELKNSSFKSSAESTLQLTIKCFGFLMIKHPYLVGLFDRSMQMCAHYRMRQITAYRHPQQKFS